MSEVLREPIEERVAQAITSTDPTVRAIQAKKFEAEHMPRFRRFARRPRRRWMLPSQQH